MTKQTKQAKQALAKQATVRLSVTVSAALYAQAMEEIKVTNAPISTVLMRWMTAGADADKVSVRVST